MELDDLKQSWNEQSKQELNPLNNDFMEMIHNKSYGPLAELKSKFKRQLITIFLALPFIIYLFLKYPSFKYNGFMYYFIFIIFIAGSFYWLNYKLVNSMQQTDSTVKETIGKNLKILENNFRKYFIVGRVYLFICIILLETFMYLHELKDFETWYSYSIFIRIAGYIALFLVAHFVSKLTYEKNFGKHISYLKELLNKIG